MKRYYIVFLIIVVSLVGCSKEDIPTYSGGDYISFVKAEKDSTEVSFFFYPGQPVIDFPVAVKVVGRPMDKDRSFAVTVWNEKGDIPQANYELPKSMVFRANRVIDTLYVKFKKTADLSTIKRKMVLRIEANDNFAVGQQDRAVAIIRLSNQISKPEWWNDDITRYYLGEYSDLRYEHFFLATKVSDLTDKLDDELRGLALKFKRYLQREKDAGRTVYENGVEMTVPIVGQ